jgi:sugar phosphate isomerase/epimerase
MKMKASYMFMSPPLADDGSTLDWRQHLADLAGAGLAGVDLFPAFMQRAGIALDDCLAVLAANGLAPAQWGVSTDFISPGADVPASLDAIKRGIDVCLRHGIRQLFSYGGQHANRGPEAMTRYVAGLQPALDLACSAGLGCSIENAGSMCHTWQELLECVERVGPGMRVTLDGGNFILAGSDPIVAAEKLGARVVHVHVKNFEPAPGKTPRPFEYCPPERGLVDYPRLAGILSGHGFDGYLSFEPEGWPHAPAVGGVRFCADLAGRFKAAH